MKLGLNLGYAPPGTNPADLAPLVIEVLKAGDIVMIKGSLGSRMGPIVKALQHLSARQNMSETGASRNGTLRAASAQG